MTPSPSTDNEDGVAFALARVRAVGVPEHVIDAHRSCRKFFDLGMASPAHKEMADTIIADPGGNPPATRTMTTP